MNYLVTGGSGFIGAALVQRLVADGHKVRVIDNNSRGRASRLDQVIDKIEFIEADIRDKEAVFSATEGVDCVCHLAYVNGTEFFYSQPELVLDIAVRGMLNVIDACRAHNVGKLVVASSSEVYQTPPTIPTDETAPLSIPDISNPRYSYGGGKILCELMSINYGRTDFDTVTIFRPHNVYGPDMGWEHVIPQLVLKAKTAIENTPEGIVSMKIQGDGSQTRAFVHIDDFIDGLMKVIESGKHLEIYHIGNPEEVTIGDLAKQIVTHLGRDVVLETEPAPEGGTMRRCPDIKKLKKLGYEPSIPLKDGIGEVIDWYVAHAGEK